MLELDKMKKEKNSVNNTLTVCISVICALWVAGCTSLPNRQVPTELSVTQERGKDPHPDEYVFCDVNGGAWGCKSVTPKTRLAEVSSEGVDGSINSVVKTTLKDLSGAKTRIANSDGEVVVDARAVANTPNESVDFAVSNKPAIQPKKTVFESVPPGASKLATVLFDFNSSLLTADAKLVLLDVLQKLNGGSLLIRGFTDDIGPSEYNDWLALRRANKVRDFFDTAHANVERIEVEGYGLCCYVEPNDFPEQRARNRRVEIYMVD